MPVPLASDEILEHGVPRPARELERIVEPGDRLSPPFIVYPPGIKDVSHLEEPVSEPDGLRCSVSSDYFDWFRFVRGTHRGKYRTFILIEQDARLLFRLETW